jgi:phage-related tail fiber protein
VDALAGKATIAALNALQTQVNNFSGAPIGSTLIWDSPTLPDDYLERNGATLSRTDFSELWAFVNGAGIVKPQASKQHTEWGDGDGSTTFSLPDWRAEHLIGWDNGRGVDAGRGLLTYQADAVKAHNHSAGSYTSPIKRRDAGLNYGQGVLQDGTWAQSLPITGTSGTTGAPTNRVRTVAVMFLVKFR